MSTLANCPPFIEVPDGIDIWASYPERLWPVHIVGNTVAYAGGPVCTKRAVLVEYDDQNLERKAKEIRDQLRKDGYSLAIAAWNPKGHTVGGEA